jgi:hypothetical protein
MSRFVLLPLLFAAGCSGLCPDDENGYPDRACVEKAERDEQEARLGWRNARANRTSPTPPSPFGQVTRLDLEHGLTRDELHSLAGLPLRRSIGDSTEVWSYAVDDSTTLDVTLVGGVVARWMYARQ